MKKYLKLFLGLSAAVMALAACSSDDDEGSVSSLTAPTNVECSSQSSTSLTFTWSEVKNATRYSARLERTNDSSDYSTETVTGTTVTFNGLSAGTSYTFKVRSLGSGNSYSDYSASITVTTASSGSDEEGGDGDDDGDDDDDNQGTVDESVYAQFLIPEEEDALGSTLAFPGAEGGGMYVTGGRGGTIYHVTTLEDNSSAGSFRYAVTRSGARTIVFDVCGTIYLNSDLTINNGDLTIAGQTAPGDGICIAQQTVRVNCDNIIIRFVRFRLGDTGSVSDGSDCIWGRYHENIILDHCTMSWSVDECASFYANKNFTMQWCMITEALNSSFHNKGDHGYGGIWGGRNASFHHNLMAHNNSRNARIDHPGIYSSYLDTHRGNVDYRNNVIYNWGSNHTYGGEDGWFNIVGNYYKSGPGSTTRKYYVDAYWYNSSSSVGSAYPELYLSDNYNTDGTNYDYGVYYHDQSSYGTNPTGVILSSPLSIKADDATTCYVTTHEVNTSFTQVVSYAGASLSRDSNDTRIANEAKNGTTTYTGSDTGKSGIIDSQSDVDGWPTLSATDSEISAQTTDTDGDGMPDWFEEQFGLDESADDASSYDLDLYGRYSNFEMYLHYLVRNVVDSQITSGTYTALD